MSSLFSPLRRSPRGSDQVPLTRQVSLNPQSSEKIVATDTKNQPKLKRSALHHAASRTEQKYSQALSLYTHRGRTCRANIRDRSSSTAAFLLLEVSTARVQRMNPAGPNPNRPQTLLWHLVWLARLSARDRMVPAAKWQSPCFGWGDCRFCVDVVGDGRGRERNGGEEALL